MTFVLKPDRPKYKVKYVRFPIEVALKIENLSKINNISSSELIVQACEFALKNMKK